MLTLCDGKNYAENIRISQNIYLDVRLPIAPLAFESSDGKLPEIGIVLSDSGTVLSIFNNLLALFFNKIVYWCPNLEYEMWNLRSLICISSVVPEPRTAHRGHPDTLSFSLLSSCSLLLGFSIVLTVFAMERPAPT